MFSFGIFVYNIIANVPLEGRLGSDENNEHHVAAYPLSQMYFLLLFYFGDSETTTGLIAESFRVIAT